MTSPMSPAGVYVPVEKEEKKLEKKRKKKSPVKSNWSPRVSSGPLSYIQTAAGAYKYKVVVNNAKINLKHRNLE